MIRDKPSYVNKLLYDITKLKDKSALIKFVNNHPFSRVLRDKLLNRGMYKKANIANKIDDVSALLRKSILTNKDACEVIEKYKNDPHAFIFLDPPYLDSNNTNYNMDARKADGEIVDNTYIYVCIVEALKTAKAKIMLIINDNKLNRYIFNDFIVGEYDRVYQVTKRKTKHLIIVNYDT